MRVEDRGVLHEVMEQQSYHPSLEVLLSSGRKVRIGDYVDNIFKISGSKIIEGKDCQIIPLESGDEVFAYDFVNHRIDRVRIARVSRHLPPDHFVRVLYSNRRGILVTPEHPVFVSRDDVIQTVRADKVRVDDFVPAPESLPKARSRVTSLKTVPLRFLRVKKVENVKNEGAVATKWVYDVTVEPHHDFISCGLILHNTVSVAKGGIVATLNARTSILAAANPVFGKYDPYKNIYENVNLPTPLLTRFDLVFIIRDIPDRAKDEKLASHILETHRAEAFTVQPPLNFDMLKKYLIYAKKVYPKLTREAQERLLQFYLDLRASSTEGTIAITPRQLEGLIRIATARARLLLRDKVTIEDALQAINLMRKMLESVGIDVRTGKVDLGVLQGRPASERSILEKAMDVFRQLHGAEKKPVEAKAFVDELVKTGDFSAEEAKRVINTLYKLGQIYEIRSGYYSKIS
jgi:replicative DNA helicase Mcm